MITFMNMLVLTFMNLLNLNKLYALKFSFRFHFQVLQKHQWPICTIKVVPLFVLENYQIICIYLTSTIQVTRY